MVASAPKKGGLEVKKNNALKAVQMTYGLAFSFWGVASLVTFIGSQFYVEKEVFEEHFLFTAETKNVL